MRSVTRLISAGLATAGLVLLIGVLTHQGGVAALGAYVGLILAIVAIAQFLILSLIHAVRPPLGHRSVDPFVLFNLGLSLSGIAFVAASSDPVSWIPLLSVSAVAFALASYAAHHAAPRIYPLILVVVSALPLLEVVRPYWRGLYFGLGTGLAVSALWTVLADHRRSRHLRAGSDISGTRP